MLSLPDVTLVVITSVYHDLTERALKDCMAVAKFGDIIAFSDVALIPEAAHVFCNPKNLSDVMDILWYRVPPFIKTSHYLVVQWDSWIINPERWSNSFLQYDYIGAPWWFEDTYNVGNGGFSLRSKRLGNFLIENKEEFPISHPEDRILCRTYGPKLRREGFMWPENDTAFSFAFECVRPERKSFGFHCLRNWPLVLKKPDLVERFSMCPKSIQNSSDYASALDLMEKLNDKCGIMAA